MRDIRAGSGYRLEAVMCLALIAMMASPTRAQGPDADAERSVAEWAGVSGSIRAGYWTSTRSLDSEQHLGAAMVWLKSSRPVSPRTCGLNSGR